MAVRETGEWVMRHFDLGDRDERWGVYSYVLRKGVPLRIYRWVDGALLVDLWPELDFPEPWQKVRPFPPDDLVQFIEYPLGEDQAVVIENDRQRAGWRGVRKQQS